MAIKGKGKTRSGRRVIAAPPRPQLVIRKPPIWKRRWVLGTVAGIALVAILFATFTWLHHKHERAFRAREAGAVLTFSNKTVRAFPADRQTVPPDLYAFYPTLSQSLDNLASGKLKPADAVKAGTSVQTSATATQQAIQQINLNTLISADFDATTAAGETAKGLTKSLLLDSQFSMEQAFLMYSRVGQLMKAAAAATGTQRAALVGQAKSELQQAGNVFDRGFRTLLEIRSVLGIPLSVGASGTSSTPGG
jgi:hypothetical protein